MALTLLKKSRNVKISSLYHSIKEQRYEVHKKFFLTKKAFILL